VVGFADTNEIVTVVFVTVVIVVARPTLRYAVPRATVHLAHVFQTIISVTNLHFAIALRQETGLLQYTGEPVKCITRSAVFLNSLDHENCPARYA
jgi:hypothetical protein